MKFGVGVEGLPIWLSGRSCCTRVFPDTGSFAKGKLKQLLREHRGAAAGFDTLGFAREIAPKFQAKRALPHSTSFKLFWERVDVKCRPADSRE